MSRKYDASMVGCLEHWILQDLKVFSDSFNEPLSVARECMSQVRSGSEWFGLVCRCGFAFFVFTPAELGPFLLIFGWFQKARKGNTATRAAFE